MNLLKIFWDDYSIRGSISVGFSYFRNGDNNFNDVIKRADDALYMSKEQGKNRVNIVL